MISAVSIKGFQSHVNTTVQLAPGLTVITGPSDSGKTSILRAVRWVAFNEPSGEAFVNEAVGEAIVCISLENGIDITKTRRKGKTTYRISTLPEPFEKAEVPQEVQQALGIVKHTFGDFEAALNFSFQLEAPFLISETASAGAKILGKLAGTEAVDLATKSVSKDIYSARNDRSQAERDKERIEAQLLDYWNLDDLKAQLEGSEVMLQQIEEDYETLNELQHKRDRYAALQDKLDDVLERIHRLSDLPNLEEDLQDIEKAQQRYDRILDLYTKHSHLTAKIVTLTEGLTEFEELEAASDRLNTLEGSNRTLTAMANLTAQYTLYTDRITDAEHILTATDQVGQADSLLQTLQEDQVKLGSLKIFRANYLRYSSSLQDAQQALHRTKDIAGAVVATLEATQADSDRLGLLKGISERYSKVGSDLHTYKEMVNESQKNQAAAQDELTSLWDEVGVCPLCEQPVKGGQHNHE